MRVRKRVRTRQKRKAPGWGFRGWDSGEVKGEGPGDADQGVIRPPARSPLGGYRKGEIGLLLRITSDFLPLDRKLMTLGTLEG